MTNNTNYEIDKTKLQLANRTEDDFEEQSFSGAPSSFLKDGWGRFKKNRLSLVAAWIIAILIFFTLVGPYMRQYDLVETDGKSAIRFAYLPPKIPVLEKLGIFDGSKVITGRNEEFILSLPDGIVKKIISVETVHGVRLVDVRVDYYRYISYIRSERDSLTTIPTVNMTFNEYTNALNRNAILELVSVENGIYKVRLDIFQYSFGTDADNVYFWFGTGSVGDDLYTQLWVGSRISILMAVAVTIINLTIGVIVGSIVGYYGGTFDLFFERLIDILNNMPFMAILTLLVLNFGGSFMVIIIAFIMTGWIGAYSSSRIQTYRYKNREFVLAARTYGASDMRIIFRHILPNAMGTLITAFSLAIPYFIFSESTYSFIGIIKYQNARGIGELLAIGQATMQQYPHLLLFPALYLSILMLSFNMFSNGLRDGFNPSLRGVED